MRNVLVTGAKGFIGKNLVARLNAEKFNVFEITRESSTIDLKEMLLQCDFVFHLAGEVRPNSTATDFKNSNVSLTKTIVDILQKNEHIIPIVLTSTVHAVESKNEYGKTKRESELIIETYSTINNIDSYIYRLPHVFGEGCKPNYNSVITTWIYNKINDLEINVYDKSIKMNYVYVQDVVCELLGMTNPYFNQNLYSYPSNIYQTTLGEVLDYLDEFKENSINKKQSIEYLEFKLKLFNVYTFYDTSSCAE